MLRRKLYCQKGFNLILLSCKILLGNLGENIRQALLPLCGFRRFRSSRFANVTFANRNVRTEFPPHQVPKRFFGGRSVFDEGVVLHCVAWMSKSADLKRWTWSLSSGRRSRCGKSASSISSLLLSSLELSIFSKRDFNTSPPCNRCTLGRRSVATIGALFS